MIETTAPKNATEIDLDGRVDNASGVRYLGKAARGEDGRWRCLADVGSALCVVEITARAAPTVVSDVVLQQAIRRPRTYRMTLSDGGVTWVELAGQYTARTDHTQWIEYIPEVKR